jgi:hypothetical protein
MNRALLCLAFAAGGCNLISTNSLSIPYTLDVQQFSQTVGDKSTPAASMPKVTCSVDADCGAGMVPLPQPMFGSCDTSTKTCKATASVRLPYTVDLSKAMSPLPTQVVQYSIDHVTISKIAYWIDLDSLTGAVPSVDIFVAPAAAKDENDPSAVKVGTVAMLPAKATQCADAVDSAGDRAADSHTVCDVPLDPAGEAALASFIKAAANQSSPVPFQLIAHTEIVVKAGDPIPLGTLQFSVHPTVSFSLLK